MNSVNLLPTNLRPREAAGARQNGAYIALGVLGVLLLAVTMYVIALNGITSNKNELAELNERKTQSDLRAGALSSFGDFQEVKATRVASVRSLADSRLDWERLLREISKVLPEGVWLTGLEGSTTPEGTAPAPAAGPAPGPSLKVSGCAKRQQTVATTLLRLRQLNLAVDVSLDESSRPEPTPGAVVAAAPAPADTGGPQDCGEDYTFAATVVLAPAASEAEEARQAPVSLGGGS